MTGPWLVFALVIAILVVFLAELFKLNFYSQTIRKMRGPWCWPVLGFIPSIVASGTYMNYITWGFSKYGKTWLGGKMLFVSPFDQRCMILTMDPANIKYIVENIELFPRLAPLAIKGVKEWAYTLKLFGNGIFLADGENWRGQRYIARNLFKKQSIQTMKPVFEEKADIVLSIIGDAADSGTVFDIQQLASKYTLDSFGKVGFGVDIDSLRKKVDFPTHFDACLVGIKDLFLDPTMKWRPQQFLDHVRSIDEYFYKFIRENNGNGKDLLSMFKNLKDEDGKPLSDKWLRDILANFMVAGRDTTSLLITWTLYLLAQHPKVTAKLIEEIKSIKSYDLSAESLASCAYLDMVVNETLRLYPPVPNTGRCIAKDTILPDGTKVYEGDYVFYMAYHVHRDPDYWEKPNEFIPERWVDKNLLTRRYNFLPFHAGEMECLGRHMAKLEAKILIAKIVSHFELELDKTQTIDPFLGITLSNLKGVLLTAKRR